MSLNFRVYQDYGGPAQALQLTFYIMIALTVLVILISYLVRVSKFGLGLMAIREDEDAAEVLGIFTQRKNLGFCAFGRHTRDDRHIVFL